MRPYAEVSRLAKSASFYSAVCHPLKLQYLRADAQTVVYGAGDLAKAATADPVFEVRAVDGDEDRPLTRARLVLSAHSPSAVSDFHAAGLRANPDLAKIGGESHFLRHPPAGGASSSSSSSTKGGAGGGESRARVTDLDGNIMEVVYLPPSHYPPDHQGSTVRRTQSSTAEASRILDWNLDVATSAAPPTARPPHHRASTSLSASASTRRPARPADANDSNTPYMTLRRSVTTSTVETSPRPREDDEEKSSGGFGLVSAVLGAVAAGAAIGGAMTYMSMRGSSAADERERETAVQQQQRRPAYPDPYPGQGQGQPQRYVEVERTVEKIRYPEDYPPVRGNRHYPPPSYVARYSQAAPTRPHEVEELDDRASRHTARQSTTGRHARTRSEAAGSARKPLMIADVEHRSNAGGSSRYTTAAPPAAPKMLMPADPRVQTARHVRPEADVFSRAASKASVPRTASRHHHADADTYVSKRTTGSRRATETMDRGSAPLPPSSTRPPPLARADTMPPPPMRSRSSRLPAMPVPTGGRRLPPGAKATMYADAGMVPLPPSEVGSTWDDDNDSVAPSDSISCIGSRRSDRSRR